MAEAPTLAIVRVGRSAWYSVRRVAEIDGHMWSIYWKLPGTIKSRAAARKAARSVGSLLPGVYVEAGVRDMVADVGDFHVTGGLTFRTPLVFAP